VIKALGLASGFFIDAVSFLFIIVALLWLPDPAHRWTRRNQCFSLFWKAFVCGQRRSAPFADAGGCGHKFLSLRADLAGTRLPGEDSIRIAGHAWRDAFFIGRRWPLRRVAGWNLEDKASRPDDASGCLRAGFVAGSLGILNGRVDHSSRIAPDGNQRRNSERPDWRMDHAGELIPQFADA